MYTAALQQLEGKINTISEEFKVLHKYNPIEHTSSRIKSKESIVNKLKKKGLELNYENLIKTINDIAGIRIICSFIPDIYKIVENFVKQKEITREMLVSLVDKIELSEDKEITIYYKFNALNMNMVKNDNKENIDKVC